MRAILGAAILASAIGWTSTEAADFRVDRQTCTVYLSGVIERDDGQAFERTIEEMIADPRRKCEAPQRLVLDSPGGYITPSIQIAQIVHLLAMETEVKADSRCVSGCAFVWFGGIIRVAYGEVGLHGVMSKHADRMNFYANRAAQDRLATLSEQFHLPAHIIARIRSANPDQIDYLSVEDKHDLLFRGNMCGEGVANIAQCRGAVIRMLRSNAAYMYLRFQAVNRVIKSQFEKSNIIDPVPNVATLQR